MSSPQNSLNNKSGVSSNDTFLPTPMQNSLSFPSSVVSSALSNNAQITSAELSVYQKYSQSNEHIRFGSEFILDPSDGTPILDEHSNPISVAKILATKPLKRDLCTRPGPGNRQLTYMSGESVTRTLNEIFGFDGWCLEIKQSNREECVKDEKGRYHVAYTAFVRLTHRRSGAFKEDCGAGDSIDRQLGTAISNALKASVTDAMKRAARHFGDKLGNSLYQGSFSIKKAPMNLKHALHIYGVERKQALGDINKKSLCPPRTPLSLEANSKQHSEQKSIVQANTVPTPSSSMQLKSGSMKEVNLSPLYRASNTTSSPQIIQKSTPKFYDAKYNPTPPNSNHTSRALKNEALAEKKSTHCKKLNMISPIDPTYNGHQSPQQNQEPNGSEGPIMQKPDVQKNAQNPYIKAPTVPKHNPYISKPSSIQKAVKGTNNPYQKTKSASESIGVTQDHSLQQSSIMNHNRNNLASGSVLSNITNLERSGSNDCNQGYYDTRKSGGILKRPASSQLSKNSETKRTTVNPYSKMKSFL